MKVSDVMSREVRVADPTYTIERVARMMSELDVGIVPVCDGDHIVGLITDRDIVLRVAGEGRDNEIPVNEVMTTHIESCRPEDRLTEVTERMAELQIRRLLVLDSAGKLAGIVSLGDIARAAPPKKVGATLEDISEG